MKYLREEFREKLNGLAEELNDTRRKMDIILDKLWENIDENNKKDAEDNIRKFRSYAGMLPGIINDMRNLCVEEILSVSIDTERKINEANTELDSEIKIAHLNDMLRNIQIAIQPHKKVTIVELPGAVESLIHEQSLCIDNLEALIQQYKMSINNPPKTCDGEYVYPGMTLYCVDRDFTGIEPVLDVEVHHLETGAVLKHDYLWYADDRYPLCNVACYYANKNEAIKAAQEMTEEKD